MRITLLIIPFWSSCLIAQDLENQLKTFDVRDNELQQQRKQLPIELSNAVYKKYIDNLKIDIHQPEIKNIIGDTAKVDVLVDYSLPIPIAKEIRSTISKYLETSSYDYDGSFNYTFDDDCYKTGSCSKKLVSPLSPDAWSFLSDQSLCMQITLLDQNNIAVLIGEKVDRFGDVSVSGKMTYHFDIKKNLIKGNPLPTYKYGICRWNWQFDRVSYDLAQEIKK